jgi:hypothetical protein
MGYPVYYNGEIEITPPLTEEDAAVVREFARGDRTDLTAPIFAAIAASDEPDLPYSCALYEVSEDRSALVPEEGESRHGLATWLTLLAKHFLKPSGYLLNGEVTWSAEQSDDRGSVFIKDNLVEIVEDIIVNPGPSWAPERFIDRTSFAAIQFLVQSADNEGCSPDLTVVFAEPVTLLREALPDLEDFVSLNLP